MDVLSKRIESYLARLKRRDVSPSTIKNYRSTLNMFAAWAENHNRKFCGESVSDFLATVPVPQTRNVYLVRLQGLGGFMRVPLDLDRSKEEVRDVEALDSNEMSKLVQAASSTSSSLRATIIFLAETGMRFSEFRAFKPESVVEFATDSGPIHAVNIVGKGRKHRTIPLSSRAVAVLGDLPGAMSQRQAENLAAAMKRAGRAAGIQFDVHPHLLRASFISILLNEKGADAVKVAKIVGHASADMLLKHYYRASIGHLHSLVA